MNNIIDESKVSALERLIIEAVLDISEKLSGFKESTFNQVPFEGSWTGGQVCSHVIKSMDFIHELINDSSEPTKRDADRYVPALKEMMEDMSAKGQSAPNLLPDNAHFTQTNIRKSMTDCYEKLERDIHSLDLSNTSTSMEFPGIGLVTRYELVSFAGFHTKRHARQLKNIHQVLSASGN